MTVRAVPFEEQPAYEDDYYRLHREVGVVSGLDMAFNGLGWSLSPGEVYSSGALVLVEDFPATGTSTLTSGANPRRDMLVARRTLVPGGGSYGEIAVLQGAPATSPDEPTSTQEFSVHEEPLWSWQVPGNGGTTVTNVRDLRRRFGGGPVGGWTRTITRDTTSPTDDYTGTGHLLGGTWIAAPPGDYMIHTTLALHSRSGNIPASLAVEAGGLRISPVEERADLPEAYVQRIHAAHPVTNWAGGDLSVNVRHSVGAATARVINGSTYVVVEYKGR